MTTLGNRQLGDWIAPPTKRPFINTPETLGSADPFFADNIKSGGVIIFLVEPALVN